MTPLAPSALALLAANAFTAYGVLVLGWDVFPLVLVYWLENVVIGIFGAARIASAAAPWRDRAGTALFFCLHYGAFALGHGLVVVALFGSAWRSDAMGFIDGLRLLARALEDYRLYPALVALAASHLFSFFWNYLKGGEYLGATPAELMDQPYRRVVVLQVVVLASAFAVLALGSPLWALVPLVVLKTVLDLRAHLREHASRARRGAGG